MKIFGDKISTKFKNHAKEPGFFFGSHDVLKGSKKTFKWYSKSFFGDHQHSKTVRPKLYLHIPTNAWTTFTGKLREYLLPWRWKTAYLDQENGTQPRKILVCTSVHDGQLTDHLSKLIGKSLFVTNLINSNQYDEYFGQEFIRLQGNIGLHRKKITHPLSEKLGSHDEFTNSILCHIYTKRSLFSRFKYNLLKQFSSSWKEVAVQAGQISEKILIKKSDEAVISQSKLTV